MSRLKIPAEKSMAEESLNLNFQVFVYGIGLQRNEATPTNTHHSWTKCTQQHKQCHKYISE